MQVCVGCAWGFVLFFFFFGATNVWWTAFFGKNAQIGVRDEKKGSVLLCPPQHKSACIGICCSTSAEAHMGVVVVPHLPSMALYQASYELMNMILTPALPRQPRILDVKPNHRSTCTHHWGLIFFLLFWSSDDPERSLLTKG